MTWRKESDMKKCIYCKKDIAEENIVDFCEDCGKRVWGEKMFNAIIKNMEEARKRGNLCHMEPDSFNVEELRKLF